MQSWKRLNIDDEHIETRAVPPMKLSTCVHTLLFTEKLSAKVDSANCTLVHFKQISAVFFPPRIIFSGEGSIIDTDIEIKEKERNQKTEKRSKGEKYRRKFYLFLFLSLSLSLCKVKSLQETHTSAHSFGYFILHQTSSVLSIQAWCGEEQSDPD